MELATKYNPSIVENKWMAHWLAKGYFNSKPNEKEAYTIVIPPPNVTGVLHMGHTLNETIQDILIRYARMTGKNACWVPGTDHASIATEAKVVAMLKDMGIDKNNLSREEFLKYAFEWKKKYGDIIINQLHKLGCSCDFNRTQFTMDEHYYEGVIKVFIDMYNNGLIYRGARMINWDPSALTALSDEEVEYREVQSKLYYIKYNLDGITLNDKPYIVVATTRPETILGDVAICANPNDERYAHLKGAYAYVPLINRKIPIIFDEYVDKEFGTGCLKITPAHDLADYNIGLKHKLPIIDTLNANGTLSEAAGRYIGEDRFIARKKIAKELEAQQQIEKVEDIKNKNGFSQRTNAVVEPRISTQWFVKMQDLAKPALEAQLSNEVKFNPDRFNNTYRHWMENIKDWCISRQLWWGQQIPAWYAPDGSFAVATSRQQAFEKLLPNNSQLKIDDLKQDEDVLDTWFSSWLWPIEVFNGITQPNNEELNYYYPTQVLVTGQDIIFFWVARMMMASYGLQHMYNPKQMIKNHRPFEDVYFTGMVRDKQGRKMSKSLGNSPELLMLIDQFGADAVRFGIMIASPAGNDLLFDESSCEQGRNFANKIFNAVKLIKGWQVNKQDEIKDEAIIFAIQWMEEKINSYEIQYHDLIKNYKLSEALKALYSLIWDDFCAWYLEMVKPGFEQPIDNYTYINTIHLLDRLLQLLHPFMPFATESFYHDLKERNTDLVISQFERKNGNDNKTTILEQGNQLQLMVSTLRDFRNKNNIKPKQNLELYIENLSHITGFNDWKNNLIKLANVELVNVKNVAAQKLAIGVIACEVHSSELANKLVNTEEAQKELDYLRGFLASVTAKLQNQKFVSNAKPEMVANERKKMADAQEKIKVLELQIAKG
jgi:valyl-tRNA synthetase